MKTSRKVVTVIDNASFTTTVTGSDIDMTRYRSIGLTAVIGTKTTTPTFTAKVQAKDSNDNYVDYYTLPTLSTGSENQADAIYDFPFNTARIVATFGGSGNFANVTLEATLMK